MEGPASLEPKPGPTVPGLARGTIRELKHLSIGSDVASTRLVAAHNSVGYGYIGTPAGDVFFDASAMSNMRFDRLTRNMTVEYALDDAPYLRTSRVTVVVDDPGFRRE